MKNPCFTKNTDTQDVPRVPLQHNHVGNLSRKHLQIVTFNSKRIITLLMYALCE